MRKIFFDSEFTGLRQDTELISIGFMAEDGCSFYAEFSDFDLKKCDQWIHENVLQNLIIMGDENIQEDVGKWMSVWGNSHYIAEKLRAWLIYIATEVWQVEQIQLWSDVYAYDWILLCDLLDDLPKEVSYIPMDIATLMEIKGIDPDISREEYAEILGQNKKHNALWDAEIILYCYEKLIEED